MLKSVKALRECIDEAERASGNKKLILQKYNLPLDKLSSLPECFAVGDLLRRYNEILEGNQ